MILFKKSQFTNLRISMLSECKGLQNFVVKLYDDQNINEGGRHSSVDLFCAFHPVTPGSSPKHAIYAFSFILFVLYLSFERTKIKTKRGRVWPI